MDVGIKRAKGIFVVFEGMDGCGKTTVMEKVAVTLKKSGRGVVQVRQPGGTPVAEDIRKILKSTDYWSEVINPLSEYLLFAAAREQLDYNVIRQAIDSGHIVLSDRHVLSTHAYQGMQIPAIDNLVARTPDITVFVDASLETCMERKAARDEVCRIEHKVDAYFKEVYDRLHQYIKDDHHGTVIRVDSEVFESKEYWKGITSVINTTISFHELAQVHLERQDHLVTVAEFEAQVLKTEHVRVIIRGDVTQKVKTYTFKRLSDDQTYGELLSRLNDTLSLPYAIASVKRNPADETPMAEIRVPINEGDYECL